MYGLSAYSFFKKIHDIDIDIKCDDDITLIIEVIQSRYKKNVNFVEAWV